MAAQIPKPKRAGSRRKFLPRQDTELPINPAPLTSLQRLLCGGAVLVTLAVVALPIRALVFEPKSKGENDGAPSKDAATSSEAFDPQKSNLPQRDYGSESIAAGQSVRTEKAVAPVAATPSPQPFRPEESDDIEEIAPAAFGDPVGTLQVVARLAGRSKVFQTPEEDWREWKRISYGTFGDELIARETSLLRRFQVEGIDVKKTDSLISPFIGFLVLSEYVEPPGSARYHYGNFRVTLVWQNNSWRAVTVHSKDSGHGDDDWTELYPSSPTAVLLRTVLPKVVRWSL